VPGKDNAHEHVEVLAAAGGRPRAEGLIEAADLLEGGTGDGEVGTRAEDAGRVRVERRLVPVFLQVEDPALAAGPPPFSQGLAAIRTSTSPPSSRASTVRCTLPPESADIGVSGVRVLIL